MYTVKNYKSKEDLAKGAKIKIFAPSLDSPKVNGIECIQGPHYPKPHTWEAEVVMKYGIKIR